jgi:hypothetical protein
MKDFGVVKKILGMKITRDINFSVLFLSHKNYIKKLLLPFNMHYAKSVVLLLLLTSRTVSIAMFYYS